MQSRVAISMIRSKPRPKPVEEVSLPPKRLASSYVPPPQICL